MVEPIFRKSDLEVVGGTPAIYSHRSEGSGKMVHVHFCQACGTKLWLSFERFADVVGVYAGTFDDPCWFPIRPETAKHIFLDVARSDSIIPPGLPAFRQHASTADGAPCAPTVYDAPHPMSDERF